MRASTRLRPLALAVAIVAAAAAPASAAATEVAVPALDATFAAGPEGWTSTSSCAPLCSVANAVDPNAGASEPGSAAVIYTSLGGPARRPRGRHEHLDVAELHLDERAPVHATLSFARRAAIGGLLNVGGSASARVQLHDLTSGDLTTIASGALSTAEGSFVPQAFTVDPGLLRTGHAYRLLITTSLSAAALLSGIRVAYDDIALTATVALQDTGQRHRIGRSRRRGGTTRDDSGREDGAPPALAAGRALHSRPALHAARAGEPCRHRGGPAGGRRARRRNRAQGHDRPRRLRADPARTARSRGPPHQVPGRRGHGLDVAAAEGRVSIRDDARARSRGA